MLARYACGSNPLHGTNSLTRERAAKHKVFALNANGKRTPLDAHGVIIELRPGIEVEIDFAPHPNFSGRLLMRTPPTRRMRTVYEAGWLDDFAVIFGATNVLHVFVERRPRTKKKSRRRSSVPRA